MPIQREHVQLAALFLCVPAQLLISQYMGSTESNRTYAISQLVGQWTHIQENWLRVESWKTWCKRLLNLKMRDIMLDPLGLMDPLGECPAVEVFKFRDKDGYFGQSPEPRDARPPHVQFRVGQVVKHKRWGYRGVIIGWDETARAPASWLEEMHKGNPTWRGQPNYAVLVDTRDRPAPQITYVPQENLEVVKHTAILHPSTEDYFENFDGSQYLPRPWLRTVYPRD